MMKYNYLLHTCYEPTYDEVQLLITYMFSTSRAIWECNINVRNGAYNDEVKPPDSTVGGHHI